MKNKYSVKEMLKDRNEKMIKDYKRLETKGIRPGIIQRAMMVKYGIKCELSVRRIAKSGDK